MSAPEGNPGPVDAEKTPSRRLSRRGLLAGAAASAASGAIGAALGYKYRNQLHAFRLSLNGRSEMGPEPFLQEARAICERHRQQTTETVRGLKAKYEKPIYGKMRVWDLVEKLSLCIDQTDTSMYCTSQFVHVQQVLEAMERQQVSDPDLFVAALVHDIGKVLLLTGEVPENVLCSAGRLDEQGPECGLDKLIYQFGHAELIYSRIKDHVPDHLAWLVRYHNIDARDAEPFMDERDRGYATKYLKPFRGFDAGFKSAYHVPDVDLSKYREMVEHYFPRPILF
jgi:hypothetical protein